MFQKGNSRQAAGHAVRVPAATAECGMEMSESCRTSGPSPTTSAWSARCTPSTTTTPRRWCCSTPARSSPAGPRSARGSATAWAPRTRTCPPTSCSATRTATTPAARSSGRTAGCRRCTAARRSARRATPVLNLQPPTPVPAGRPERRPRPAGRSSTRSTASSYPHESELEARIRNYELAARMQLAAGEVLDLVEGDRRRRGSCTASTTRRRPATALRCLMARRLVERGVRFVQVFPPVKPQFQPWDAHDERQDRERGDLRRDRPALRRPDQGPEGARPARRARSCSGRASSAGCRSRRTARAATTTATPSACSWPAAASRRGHVHGATDEVGYQAAEEPRQRARPARHDPAPARPRPRQLDLSATTAATRR